MGYFIGYNKMINCTVIKDGFTFKSKNEFANNLNIPPPLFKDKDGMEYNLQGKYNRALERLYIISLVKTKGK